MLATQISVNEMQNKHWRPAWQLSGEICYFSSILNFIFNTISAYAIIFLHPTLHHIMRFMHSSENIFTKTDLVMKFISSRVWCFRSAFSKNETTNKVKSNQFSGLWFLKISSSQKMSWLGIRSGRNKDNKQLVRPLKKIELTAGGKNNSSHNVAGAGESGTGPSGVPALTHIESLEEQFATKSQSNVS